MWSPDCWKLPCVISKRPQYLKYPDGPSTQIWRYLAPSTMHIVGLGIACGGAITHPYTQIGNASFHSLGGS